jgi:hypothetical protein
MSDPDPALTASIAQCLVGNAVWISDGQRRWQGIVRAVDVEQREKVLFKTF